MIIDTSVIIAILQVEEDYRELGKAIIDCVGARKMSSSNYLEASIVVDRNASSAVAAVAISSFFILVSLVGFYPEGQARTSPPKRKAGKATTIAAF